MATAHEVVLHSLWKADGRLRAAIWRKLLRGCGPGPRFDRGVRIRNPSKVRIGSNVWLKEGCLLDGRSQRPAGIVIGDNVVIRAYSYIDAYDGNGHVRIGDRVGIGQFVYIGGNGSVDVGDDAMISGHTYIVSANHIFDANSDIPYHAQGETRQGVTIGRNAWVAARCVVLDGVSIGEGAVVAAGSVVTRNVDPFTLAAGVPARHLRTLK